MFGGQRYYDSALMDCDAYVLVCSDSSRFMLGILFLADLVHPPFSLPLSSLPPPIPHSLSPAPIEHDDQGRTVQDALVVLWIVSKKL